MALEDRCPAVYPRVLRQPDWVKLLLRKAVNPSRYFANYVERQPRVPHAFWLALRVLTLAGTLGLVSALVVQPETASVVWWSVIVPSLPLVLLIVPGFWRQVCPMAFLNQMPRAMGFTRAWTLPGSLRSSAFGISVVAFVGAIALRVPVLNASGLATAALIAGSLGLAFLGGVIFKGRSGWCGTFCPLAPIQRVYGQAPPVVVRNGYCPSCVNCQKNCYDFSPRSVVHADLTDADPRYSGQRRAFYAMLPGLIFGYFLQGPHPGYGEPLHALILLGACCVSVGVHSLVGLFSPIGPFRLATASASLAISAFYWFTAPGIVDNLAILLQLDRPSETARFALACSGPLAGAVLLVCSAVSERVQLASKAPISEPAAAPSTPPTSIAGSNVVTDRATGLAFPVERGATLLDAIEQAGLPISFGCRAGFCGADPVLVTDGATNLSPIGSDEAATLRRLGLDGQARMACMCRVQGPLTIDRDPASAKRSPAKVLPAEAFDRARVAGIRRVVIVGNGVAGMSAAELLRKASASVEISVVTNEPSHFYNRMAIGRLINGRHGMDGLQLMSDSWFADNHVDVWRTTVAARISRASKRLILATGEHLTYDKLILATGSQGGVPSEEFLDHPNAFVLRSADDGRAIRSYVQVHGAERAVVIGGGVLGVEVAEVLRKLNLHVTLLHRSDRLLNGHLDHEGSARLARFLEGLGIQVVLNARIEGWTAADGVLRAARLAHGPRVRGDLFVACLGLQPNLHLAREAGLATRRGIVVDACLQTSDPDIYAVGDVAEAPVGPNGLWQIGIAQADSAVSTLIGLAKPYQPPRVLLHLKSDGLDLRAFGQLATEPGDEEFTALPGGAVWWRVILRRGSIVGAIYVGPTRTDRAFTKVVSENIDVEPVRGALIEGDASAFDRLVDS